MLVLVVRWSETMEAHYGLPPGAFTGTIEAFISRVHPDDRASVRDTFATAMKSGAEFTVHNRAIRPDGTVRWLSGAGRVLLNDQGQPSASIPIEISKVEAGNAPKSSARLRSMLKSGCAGPRGNGRPAHRSASSRKRSIDCTPG